MISSYHCKWKLANTSRNVENFNQGEGRRVTRNMEVTISSSRNRSKVSKLNRENPKLGWNCICNSILVNITNTKTLMNSFWMYNKNHLGWFKQKMAKLEKIIVVIWLTVSDQFRKTKNWYRLTKSKEKVKLVTLK